MRRLLIAGVFVIGTACGPTDHPVAGSSASPSPNGLFSPPFVSIARAPVPLPPGVACRLPYAEISEFAGGFVLYPGGRRVPDPAAAVGGGPGVNPGLTYVAAAQSWVPVPHAWVAPSGQFYVSRDPQTGVTHGVSLVDGSTGLVTTDGGWWPIAATDQGVYLSRGGQPGAWYVAFGSPPKQVTDAGTWQQYGFGALWGVDSSAAILRLDLSTGAQTIYATALSVSFVSGFTLNGEPIVATGGELAIYSAGGGKTEVWPGTNGLGAGSPFADQLGVWFSVGGGLVGAPGHGVYLWTPIDGAQLISTPEAYPAGPCAA